MYSRSLFGMRERERHKFKDKQECYHILRLAWSSVPHKVFVFNKFYEWKLAHPHIPRIMSLLSTCMSRVFFFFAYWSTLISLKNVQIMMKFCPLLRTYYVAILFLFFCSQCISIKPCQLKNWCLWIFNVANIKVKWYFCSTSGLFILYKISFIFFKSFSFTGNGNIAFLWFCISCTMRWLLLHFLFGSYVFVLVMVQFKFSISSTQKMVMSLH